MAVRVEKIEPWNGVRGTTSFRVMSGERAVAGPVVLIVGLTHGNEPVGKHAVEVLRKEAAEFLTKGELRLALSNLDAAAEGRRHTADGVDLNRLWSRASIDGLAGREPRNPEERRVYELAPFVLGADVILDLHSTSQPSEAFLVVRDDARHNEMALQIGVKNVLVGVHENTLLDGGVLSNAGLDAGERSDKLGFTLECGQHQDPTNAERALQAAHRMLHALGMWSGPVEPVRVEPDIYEMIERFVQAPRDAEPWRFVGAEGGEPGSGRIGPPRPLASFTQVEAGEMVVRRGDSSVFRAQAPFTLMMPAPKTDPGTDLFFFAQRRHGGLTRGQRRSDEVARVEARAIERMMDLLDDDAFAAGNTRVSFESRQVLDVCAEFVGRTIRLPEGHPDRRITVVGGGEWGGDEAERRAGARYRSAMKAALKGGVPLDRFQLLRGSSARWLETLTGPGTAKMLAERGHPGVRLMLSLQHPNTVSMLVTGDLERALRTGDFRNLRVGLVIEAATVEPDGPRAQVRVVRAGLFGTSLPFVLVAQGFLKGLVAEHRHLLERPLLTSDPALPALLDAEGWLLARPDGSLQQLRDLLRRLQGRLFADALLAAIPAAVRLPKDASRGRWLAAVCSAASVLDLESFQSLAVTEEGDDWVIDPERIRALRRHPRGGPEVKVVHHPSPAQPSSSDEVDADNLERWVGWKRFVASTENIPGIRGRDVELAFTGPEIQGKVLQWYRWARELGARRPGQVQVLVAGDGLSPVREQDGIAWETVVAHRALAADPNVGYLRIQHGPGTHLSWLKDLFGTLDRRAGGLPFGLQWEEQHGAAVNVLLVCTREGAAGEHPWTLEGWTVEACLVLVSDLSQVGGAYRVAVSSRSEGGRPGSPELLQFGRSHCEGLLRQDGRRVLAQFGTTARADLDAAVVVQIADWIRWVRYWPASELPDRGPARVEWVAGQLGLADLALAQAIADEVGSGRTPEVAAQALWDAVVPWPGPVADGLFGPVVAARG